MSATRIDVKDLVVRYGDAVAVNGVSFTVGRGEHLTLLGPSGCGKTTTLRAIAGLEQPSAGSITVDGQAMFDSAARRNVPAEQRGVSMVFQSYAVWPHMTVFDNVAYGLRVRKQGAAELKANVERALDLVQMRHLAERGASKLSGGQQQRVALARAIAFSPTVVLFDEPLSNLDAKLRAEMRVELRELQRRLDITSVYVTHDQVFDVDARGTHAISLVAPRVRRNRIISATITVKVWISAIAAVSSVPEVAKALTIDGAITLALGPIRNTEAPSSRTQAMKISSHAARMPGFRSGRVTVRI